MTPEQIEFHRKNFEKWFIGDLDVKLKRDAAGNYTFMNAYAAWNAWISAIESIEVDISTDFLIPSTDGATNTQKCLHCLKTYKSIQSLGLKVKEL